MRRRYDRDSRVWAIGGVLVKVYVAGFETDPSFWGDSPILSKQFQTHEHKLTSTQPINRSSFAQTTSHQRLRCGYLPLRKTQFHFRYQTRKLGKQRRSLERYLNHVREMEKVVHDFCIFASLLWISADFRSIYSLLTLYCGNAKRPLRKYRIHAHEGL